MIWMTKHGYAAKYHPSPIATVSIRRLILSILTWAHWARIGHGPKRMITPNGASRFINRGYVSAILTGWCHNGNAAAAVSRLKIRRCGRRYQKQHLFWRLLELHA